jgi:hypothetical protein
MGWQAGGALWAGARPRGGCAGVWPRSGCAGGGLGLVCCARFAGCWALRARPLVCPLRGLLGASRPAFGLPASRPAFGLPASWVVWRFAPGLRAGTGWAGLCCERRVHGMPSAVKGALPAVSAVNAPFTASRMPSTRLSRHARCPEMFPRVGWLLGSCLCPEGALRDSGHVSKVPFGSFNVPKVPFETSAMSRRCPSRHATTKLNHCQCSPRPHPTERRVHDVRRVLKGAVMSLGDMNAPFRTVAVS